MQGEEPFYLPVLLQSSGTLIQRMEPKIVSVLKPRSVDRLTMNEGRHPQTIAGRGSGIVSLPNPGEIVRMGCGFLQSLRRTSASGFLEILSLAPASSQKRLVLALSICAITATLTLVAPITAVGQSSPTATRDLELSTFVGVTGTYTSLSGGRNLGVTAGIDLGFHPFLHLLPSVELRGTYPLRSGAVVGEESFEGGFRVQKRIRKIRPYADILFGRGQLNYENGGYIVPSQNFQYLQSSSNVISPGVGVEVDLNEHFALLLDGQYEHWNLPFTPNSNSTATDSIFAKAGTIGIVYRLGWLQHGHLAP